MTKGHDAHSNDLARRLSNSGAWAALLTIGLGVVRKRRLHRLHAVEPLGELFRADAAVELQDLAGRLTAFLGTSAAVQALSKMQVRLNRMHWASQA